MKTENTSTRERLLSGGLDLMSETGISGVTLGVLAEQTGLSKSGLFAHFRSKEDLQIALLQKMAEVATEHVILPAMAAPEGLQRLEALVGRWLGWTRRAGLRGGCPIAAALFELDDIEGAVRKHVLAMEAEWRGLLRQLVQQAIDCGDLRTDTDAGQFVWEVCGIYLSHHASYRFVRETDADQRAHIAFQALIDRFRTTSLLEEAGE